MARTPEETIAWLEGHPEFPNRDALLRQAYASRAKTGSEAGLQNTAQSASDLSMGAQQGMGRLSAETAEARSYLRDLMNGKNSLSAEQLRQGLQQQYSAQQSMAAGARPQNAAMMARSASMNAGRAGTAMAGQQAMAGIAERNAAAQSFGNMALSERGQEAQTALGGLNIAGDVQGKIFEVSNQQLQEELRRNQQAKQDQMDRGAAVVGTIAGGIPTGGKSGGKDYGYNDDGSYKPNK